MASERERMLAGEPYDPRDPELASARLRARELCRLLNQFAPADEAQRRSLLKKLFSSGGDTVWLEPPFYCDYGSNIHLGERVYFNFNCVILDVCPVQIGSDSFFGPGVQIYAASHPLNHEERRRWEYGKPVRIGSDVWVGGGAIICPGVSIGSRVVIGAGSVVTRNLPDGVLAVGNPARIIRTIDERTITDSDRSSSGT